MSYQRERDEFLSLMGAEGVRPEHTRALLRYATTLQKLAELECSSEAADRDRVRCPGDDKTSGMCLCRDYGSFDAERVIYSRIHHCRECGNAWRAVVEMSEHTPNLSGEATPNCPKCGGRGITSDPITAREVPHGKVPRIAVKGAQVEALVRKVCAAMGPGFVPVLGGDPRGAVLKIKVPSGRSNGWERDGICVPARGYSAAEMERICR